jgi:carboxyl-terminal processing protease
VTRILNRARAVIALAVLTGALVTGGWLLQRGLSGGAGLTFGRARLFDDVLTHVERDFVDSIPASQLYIKAATGMVRGLNDPYSAFLPPDQLSALSETTSGSYAGLGVQVDLRDGWIIIIAPLPGSPAERAGIQAGDRIVSLDGQSSSGWTIEQASRALRGTPGTSVALEIERPGVAQQLPFTVVRRDIHVASVRHPVMLDDHVGYVDLAIFSDSSADELRDAIGALRRRGMKTLIFDLRSNPGGLLEQGVGVAGLFLDRGQMIVSMRGRTGQITHDFKNDTRQLWPDLSLITLVDGHTASAAEIVAGALQDHDRAVILGTTTYGKGVAQSVFPLADGAGALKLTTARWFTPLGRSIQKPRADTVAGDDDNGDAVPLRDSAGAGGPLAARAVFHTDAGRVVFGGGGITPDVLVAMDTANGTLAFQRHLGPDIQRFRDALTEDALAVKVAHQVTSPGFAVTPAMRAALWHRLTAKGVTLSRAQFDSAQAQVDQLLGQEIARFVFGSDDAFRRTIPGDHAIAAALDLAAGARSQHDLLVKAAAQRGAKREDAPPRP